MKIGLIDFTPNLIGIYDKLLLLENIFETLEVVHHDAVDATLQAHNTAILERDVSENKYNTLALEASYLAGPDTGVLSESHLRLIPHYIRSFFRYPSSRFDTSI